MQSNGAAPRKAGRKKGSIDKWVAARRKFILKQRKKKNPPPIETIRTIWNAAHPDRKVSLSTIKMDLRRAMESGADELVEESRRRAINRRSELARGRVPHAAPLFGYDRVYLDDHEQEKLRIPYGVNGIQQRNQWQCVWRKTGHVPTREMIVLAKEWALAGKSFHSIAREFNRRKIPEFWGLVPFDDTRVRRIFENRGYANIVEIGKRSRGRYFSVDELDGGPLSRSDLEIYEPYWSADECQQLARIVGARKKDTSTWQRNRKKWLLSGRLICDHCGQKMTRGKYRLAGSRKPEKSGAYRCNRAGSVPGVHPGTFTYPGVCAREIEDSVLDELVKRGGLSKSVRKAGNQDRLRAAVCEKILQIRFRADLVKHRAGNKSCVRSWTIFFADETSVRVQLDDRQPDRLLNRILRIIADHPGVAHPEICRRAACDPSTASYNIGILLARKEIARHPGAVGFVLAANWETAIPSYDPSWEARRDAPKIRKMIDLLAESAAASLTSTEIAKRLKYRRRTDCSPQFAAGIRFGVFVKDRTGWGYSLSPKLPASVTGATL